MKKDANNPIPRSRPAIDWTALRQQVEDARVALDQGVAVSPERRRQILDERARQAAVEPPAVDATRRQIDIIEFSLAHESYGLESGFVQEVAPLGDYTPVPGAPPFVLGVINRRGRIVSVVDLKRFFDLPDRGLTDMNKVIVLRRQEMEFGLLADAVHAVRTLPAGQWQAPPPTLTGLRAAWSQGVTAGGLILLNAARLLASPELIVQDVNP